MLDDHFTKNQHCANYTSGWMNELFNVPVPGMYYFPVVCYEKHAIRHCDTMQIVTYQGESIKAMKKRQSR